MVSGYRNDPEKHAAYNREWGRKNPDRKADIALKTRLGLPHGSYARMLAEQGGKCAICETDKPGGPGRFPVDHDNITGQIRGLLCTNCNTGIGSLMHSEVFLEKAISYLKKYSSSESPRI